MTRALASARCSSIVLLTSVVRVLLSGTAEDDPILGRQELEAVLAGKQKALFVGITCGLSAPYVAGQLDYAMDRKDTTTVLMGPSDSASCLLLGWFKPTPVFRCRIQSGGAGSQDAH